MIRMLEKDKKTKPIQELQDGRLNMCVYFLLPAKVPVN